MIRVHEFCIRARVEHRVVETWMEAGWLLPQRQPDLTFTEVDLARAILIRELKEDFGVNDEGVSLILHLLDQLHGLRRSLCELGQELRQNRPSKPAQARRARDRVRRS